MENERNIKRYTAAELEDMRTRGETFTDWARVDAKTEEELEHDIAADPDWADVPEDWYKTAVATMPTPQKLLSLRLDANVVDWFQQQGPDYQTRINAVLKAFVELNGSKVGP